MKLPVPFLQKEESEYYLSLLLRDEKVSAFVFKEDQGKIRLIGMAEDRFDDSIENASTDKLIEIIDRIIGLAEANLPQNVETKKTVFGLKESWIKAGKIQEEYLIKLKKLCDVLGLDPIGFLTISEAIVYALQKEEGAPVSAILVEAGKNSVSVSGVRASKIVDSIKNPIDNSLPETVENSLKHFTSFEVLPSRIILFNAGPQHHKKESQEIAQEFIGFSWNRSLPFLHIPQVQILPPEFDAHALLVGTATQMGFDVLDEGNTPRPADVEASETSLLPLEQFGFVKNKDITQTPEKTRDVSLESTTDIPPATHKTQQDLQAIEKPHLKVNHMETNAQPQMTSFLKNLSRGVNDILDHIQLPSFEKNFPLPRGRSILFTGTLVGLLCLILLLYFFALKAKVTLSVSPKIFTQSQNITIVKNGTTDFSSHVIEGKTYSVSQQGDVSAQTTGKKEVGEKSKGTIVIYNSDLSEGKKFEKGTKIKASNDLEFTLDDEVKIASASGDASSIKSSTAKVSVTAAEIGKEYNMPSNTKFSVSSLASSLVLGKNDSAFSGGLKKEVSAVSQKDFDKLQGELIKKFESKATEELKKNTSKDEQLIPNFIKTQVSKKSFNKKVNDEADKLTLSATVVYTGVLYKIKDIDEYTRSYINNRTAKDLTLLKSNLKTNLKDMKEKGEGDFSAVLEMKALLIPKIDTASLIRDITGTSFKEAESKLSKLKQTTDVDIELQPPLSFLPRRLPQISRNITIVTEIHE